MRFYYDLHIHTALSPCAENDMTPNNIVNMALLKELDIIAITDHNSCLNVRACAEAAREAGLMLIPGMEVETSEETHFIALFPDTVAAESFGRTIERQLPKIKNRADIFGDQYIIDENDEITGSYETLLLNAAGIGVAELYSEAGRLGAAVFPAHVDRGSNSVISNLGTMPELPCGFVEISARTEPEAYLAANARLFSKRYDYLINSDAHGLGAINERVAYLKFDKRPSAGEFIDRLRNGELRG